MEDTLEKALAKIFPIKDAVVDPNGTTPTNPSSDPTVTPAPGDTTKPTMKDLAKKANTVFDEAQKAMKDGNWAVYGDKLKELSSLLKQLENN